jgi:hypothetical protein
VILTSFILAALTFNPALAPASDSGVIAGTIQADSISPDFTCKPGAICAKKSMPSPRNGCFFNNFYNGSEGGTPLTVNVTETGSNHSAVFIYWVNATNMALTIKGKATANYYCPKVPR